MRPRRRAARAPPGQAAARRPPLHRPGMRPAPGSEPARTRSAAQGGAGQYVTGGETGPRGRTVRTSTEESRLSTEQPMTRLTRAVDTRPARVPSIAKGRTHAAAVA